MYAFIKLFEFSWSGNMRILVILGSPRDLVCTILFKKKEIKCENLNKLPDLINKLSLACVRYEYVELFKHGP